MATYYKVVRVSRRGEYRSAVINGKACLHYVLGERTAGFEGMPVFLFRHKSAAEEFASRNLYILAGTAGTPRPQGWRGSVLRGLRELRRFWQNGLFTRYTAPPGTYVADWFEPKRVV